MEWGTPYDGNTRDAQDIMGPNGEHIVCFGHDYDEYGGIERPEDAHLVSAAPELLDVAHEFVAYCFNEVGSWGTDDPIAPLYRQAIEAINKAEGRA